MSLILKVNPLHFNSSEIVRYVLYTNFINIFEVFYRLFFTTFYSEIFNYKYLSDRFL